MQLSAAFREYGLEMPELSTNQRLGVWILVAATKVLVRFGPKIRREIGNGKPDVSARPAVARARVAFRCVPALRERRGARLRCARRFPVPSCPLLCGPSESAPGRGGNECRCGQGRA